MKVISSSALTTDWPARVPGTGSVSVTVRWVSTVSVGGGPGRATGSARVGVPVASVPKVPAGSAPAVLRPSSGSSENTGDCDRWAGSSPIWASTHRPSPGGAVPTAAVMRSESPSRVASVAPAAVHRVPSVLVSTVPPTASPSLASNEARVRSPAGSPKTTETRYAPEGRATGAANPRVTNRLASLPMPSPSPTATDCTASAGSMAVAAATRSAPTKAMIGRGNGVTGGGAWAPPSTIEPTTPSSTTSATAPATASADPER